MAFIPIDEQKFLQALSAPLVSATDEPNQKKKKLYEKLESIAPEEIKEYIGSSGQALETDKQLEERAKETVEQDIGAQIESYLQKYQTSKDKAQTKLSTSQEQTADKIQNLQAALEKNSHSAKERAVKQGIARSSITNGVLENYIAEFNQNQSAAIKKAQEIKDEIQKTIDALDEEKKSALNNFDIKKGLEIQEKIAKLKKERDKNAVNTQKAEEEFLQDLNSPYLIERASQVMAYYNDFDPKQAIADFKEDQNLKKYLGSYYGVIYSLLSSRERNAK